MNLTELSIEHHEQMEESGFYDNDRNLGELLMLCVTELAEAMQADRRNKINPDLGEFETWADHSNLKAGGWAHCYENTIKDYLPQELAGAILRILDICAYLEIDIQKFVDLEREYLKLRKKKHGKKY
jgi:hypothetical protein